MTDFCFLFHLYAELEVEPSKKLVRDLQKFYPANQTICIFDGYTNSELKQYLELKNVTVIESKRLKPQKNGAAWLIRFLEKFLELSNAKALIKLDPDTLVMRSFKELPATETDIAGTLLRNESIQFISGGCVWIKREAISKILSSQMLLDNRYKMLPIFGYNLTSSDEPSLVETFVLSQVASILNLKQDNWSDVLCNVLPIEKASDEWSIFHPLKYNVDSKPVEPVNKTPSLTVAKARIQEEIIKLAAKKQQQLVASYPEQEQKSWEGPDGKVAEARAILSEGISAARAVKTEAIASFKPTTEAEIEAATIALARIIVQKSEELRHALGFIAGTRANKWAEVQALTDVQKVLNYPVKEGW